MEKTADDHFADWEGDTFGYGYGSGEEHIIPALKSFFDAIPDTADKPAAYDHDVLTQAVTPTVAWMLINTLCHANLIEYGTSPHYGWLNHKGMALKAYIDSKTADELLEVLSRGEDYHHCYPNTCNCGINGFEAGRVCANPFWVTA